MKKFFAVAAAVCLLGLASQVSAQGRPQFPQITPGTPHYAVGPGWYQVRVPSAGVLSVWTEGNFYDTVGEIYDMDGRLLAHDDDGGTGTNTRVTALVGAGTYFVAVGILGGGTGPFVIRAEVSRQ